MTQASLVIGDMEDSRSPNTIEKVEDNVELLRQILTKEQHREVAYDEATEIGQSLIEFFEVLATQT